MNVLMNQSSVHISIALFVSSGTRGNRAVAASHGNEALMSIRRVGAITA